jgi:hypothetical protein
MFDDVVGTATQAATSIVATIAPGAVNDLVLIGLVGASVQVVSNAGTQVLTIPAPVAPETTSGLSFTALGHVSGNVVVTISGPSTVRCGNVSIGTLSTLGETEHGSGLGVIDYSRRTVDEFGTATLLKRGYAKRLQCKVKLPSSEVNRVVAVMTAMRSLPAMWVGAAGYDSMAVYGYYKTWSVELTEFAVATLSIELESLVLDAASGAGSYTPPANINTALTAQTIAAGPFYPVDYVGPVISTAEAAFILRSDGRASWEKRNSGSIYASGDYATQWASDGVIDVDTASRYECQFGASAEWLGMGSDRRVSVFAPPLSPQTEAIAVKIRRASTGEVLESATITIIARVYAP